MRWKAPRCMWDECNAEADGALHAQWSVVDFDTWDVCAAHYLDMLEVVSQRRVDGKLWSDMWSVWWDDEGDYVDELAERKGKT